MLSIEELIQHIRGCSLNNRDSQKRIFDSFYGYAISICSRYTINHLDATEILNDGFLKVFKRINQFKPAYEDVMNSFKGWLRKIMVNTAIDYNRKYYKYESFVPFSANEMELKTMEESALDKISYNEIIKAIRNLTPAYRTILNLYIIEGYTHQEIAEKLGIAEGTSKSNLSKAKVQLQKLLLSNQTVLEENEAG